MKEQCWSGGPQGALGPRASLLPSHPSSSSSAPCPLPGVRRLHHVWLLPAPRGQALPAGSAGGWVGGGGGLRLNSSVCPLRAMRDEVQPLGAWCRMRFCHAAPRLRFPLVRVLTPACPAPAPHPLPVLAAGRAARGARGCGGSPGAPLCAGGGRAGSIGPAAAALCRAFAARAAAGLPRASAHPLHSPKDSSPRPLHPCRPTRWSLCPTLTPRRRWSPWTQTAPPRPPTAPAPAAAAGASGRQRGTGQLQRWCALPRSRGWLAGRRAAGGPLPLLLSVSSPSPPLRALPPAAAPAPPPAGW